VQKVIFPLVVAIAVLVAGARASAAIQGIVTLVVNPTAKTWQVYVQDTNSTANLGIYGFGAYISASAGNVLIDGTATGSNADSTWAVTAPATTGTLGFTAFVDGGVDSSGNSTTTPLSVNPATNQAGSIQNGKSVFWVGLPGASETGATGASVSSTGQFTGYTDRNGDVVSALAKSSTNNIAGDAVTSFQGFTGTVTGVEMFQGSYDTAGATLSLLNNSVDSPSMTVFKTTDGTAAASGLALFTNYLTSASFTVSTTVLVPVATPEPASMALLGLGGLLMIARRRRAC
jgi:hypothetical protein